MKLDFLLNNIKRDLKLLDRIDGEKVSIYDVEKVIKRWSQALKDENELTKYEQRFQELLQKEQFSRDDFTEAMHLVLLIHQPLISGRNDVVGVRLRDADFLRVHNRVVRLPLEAGIEDYHKQLAEIEREQKEKKKRTKNNEKEIIELDIKSL